VSCPCDVPGWQSHMMWTYFRSYGPLALIFKLPHDSLSPMDLVPGLSSGVSVRLIVGGEDAVAPPRFTEEYASALRARGTNVAVAVLPGLEHNIFLEPMVLDSLEDFVAQAASFPPL
jgi:acetyl esterase/lipase